MLAVKSYKDYLLNVRSIEVVNDMTEIYKNDPIYINEDLKQDYLPVIKEKRTIHLINAKKINFGKKL